MSRMCRITVISWKPRFHELEHESKMRLPKTHSHTSERRRHLLCCPADDATCYDQGRDTLYSWTGLPIKSVLVGAHVCCLLRDRRRAVLFLSCTPRLRAKLVPRWWFSIQDTPIKYQVPGTTNTIPIADEITGLSASFKAVL